MFKFIKLTEVMNGGDYKIVLLNTAHISHIQNGLNGKNTHVSIMNGRGEYAYYFVKETAEEIWQQIICDMTKPPVIMTAEEAAKFFKIEKVK